MDVEQSCSVYNKVNDVKMKQLTPKEVIKHIRKKSPFLFWTGVSLLISFVLILIFLALFKFIKALFFILLFVIIGGYSMIYQRVIRWSLGFELVFTGTVLCGIAYGPLAGAIVGFVGLLLGEILSMKIAPQTIVSFVAIVIVGIMSSVIYNGNVFSTGITLLLLYNLIIMPLYYMMGSNPVKCFAFSATHILFHWWMFKHIAPMILKVMV